MKIIKKSIIDISDKSSSLYNLSEKMSSCYGVTITSRIFTYELTNNQQVCFSINHLNDIFYDWVNGEPYCKKKIAGSIEDSNYTSSKKEIYKAFSDVNLQFTQDESTLYIKELWEEIAQNFTLPPTHVYLHNPDFDSVFACGIFWQFCFIYLNDKTKQGIIIAAESWD